MEIYFVKVIENKLIFDVLIFFILMSLIMLFVEIRIFFFLYDLGKSFGRFMFFLL